MESTWKAVEDGIEEATGRRFGPASRGPVGGGCINQAYVLESRSERLFVKLNDASGLAMFEAEVAGLRALADTETVRVPAPVCAGLAGERAFLVLEHLPLAGGSGASAAGLGRALAALHGVAQAEFGFEADNFIGSTTQVNAPSGDWPAFYRDRRLRFQLDLASRRGLLPDDLRLGERVCERVPDLLAGHEVASALVHGDLWGGNWGVVQGGAVVFDPAVYRADSDVDLAMTELFGGFPRAFYDAYREVRPVRPGYEVRRTLYNLYHVLNHFNLFGGGYGGQARRMMAWLLERVR
jgi:fructosamine-3-kinase